MISGLVLVGKVDSHMNVLKFRDILVVIEARYVFYKITTKVKKFVVNSSMEAF